MQISDKGLDFLKRLEGCVKVDGKHVIYDDVTGRPVPDGAPLPVGATIGYGHLILPGENFQYGITEDKATDLLHTDILTAQRAVNNNIIVPLIQHQHDALVVLIYNIGVNNFIKSTLIKYINIPGFHSGRYPTMESAWRAWNMSHGTISYGLIRRRDAEWRLFKNADYTGYR